MRVAEDQDLRSLLSEAQVEAHLRQLGVSVTRPDLPSLRLLLGAYLGRIPFQNVTMLARQRRAPTLREVVADVLSGQGGPCGVMNPFFAALLHRLGYDVCLLSGSMAQPDCHIALSVQIAGQDFWLDVGNGHPYREPIQLGDESPRTEAGLTYRLRSLTEEGAAGSYAIEHLFEPDTPWRRSYTFRLIPRSFASFAEMIHRHYTTPGYGPFLGGLRIIRCPDGVLHALRDRTLLVSDRTPVRQELPDEQALLAAVAHCFGDADLPVSAALDALRAAGAPLFPEAKDDP